MFTELTEQILVIRQTLAPLRMSRYKLAKLFILHLVHQLSTTAIAALIGILVLTPIATLMLMSRRKKLSALDIPVVGSGRNREKDFDKMLQEGAAKYPEQLYLVKSASWDYVVCPSSMFDEVKALPENTASLQAYFRTTTFGKYTKIGHESDAMINAISVNLARASPSKIHERQKDCRSACDSYLGVCDDWTPVQVIPIFFRVVARMNAASLIGREAGDTDKWAGLLLSFLMSLFIPVMWLNKVPTAAVPLFAGPLFLWNKIVVWRLNSLLGPIIQKDIEEFNDETSSADKALSSVRDSPRLPFTSWLLSRYKQKPRMNRLVLDYLLTNFEATPSTTSSLYNVLFDLAAHPEICDMLRDEIAEVTVDGQLPLTPLNELSKMDSVMRESFRLNAFSLFALHRQLRKPVQLSKGPPLPAGTYICVDASSIYSSSELWVEPHKYDPLRFHRLRSENPHEQHRYLFVTSDKSSPGFGGGTQGCPGKMWASSSIKILLTYILQNYDLKLRPGEVGPKRINMPNGTKAPDMKAEILFKSRKGASLSFSAPTTDPKVNN